VATLPAPHCSMCLAATKRRWLWRRRWRWRLWWRPAAGRLRLERAGVRWRIPEPAGGRWVRG
jgi:hypothetical protein